MKYRIGAFTATVIPRKYSLKDKVRILSVKKKKGRTVSRSSPEVMSKGHI